MSKLRKKHHKAFRKALGITLAGVGMLNLALPILAEGTAAGIVITNTATATFEDGGVVKTTTSNTVELKIAEVAGITNISQPAVDPNGGSVIPGDTVLFPFLITNTGNDATGIYIPNTVTSQNLNNRLILIDTDNDGTPDYVIDPADSSLSVASANGNGTYSKGAASTDLVQQSGAGYIVPGIAADSSITVTVQGTVANAVSGSLVTVQLGDTGSNDSSNPDSQNQPDSSDTSLANEVRTVDGTDGSTGEAAGTPVNGEREASDTSSPMTVGQVANTPLALATLSKTAASVDDQSTPAFTDDVITYNLQLKVENSVPISLSGYDAAPLEGTSITVDGGTANYVLVSDAQPTNAEFDLTQTPLAPSANWTVVYTSEALTTAATSAQWYTSSAAALAGANNTGVITRIGFVYNTDTLGAISTNTTVSGFTLYVVASGVGATPDPVYNLAQVFGETEGDPGNTIVFDESGDQNPNNFNDDGTAFQNNPYGDYNPANDLGDAGTPLDADSDTNNNNTGDGDNGEPNKLVLSTPPAPPPAGNLKNGPLNQANAEGTVGDNDDFTNKAIAEGVTTDVNVDPAAVTFTNSVRNVSGIDLDNIIIRPISPTLANSVCASCDYITDPLPNGTVVTIEYDLNNNSAIDPNTESAEYTWNGSSFVLTGGDPTIEIATLAVGEEIDYNVIVDVPGGAPFLGYSVPVVAYVDNDNNDSFDPTNEVINNITIDTLYTGYLKLTKEARILYANGSTSAWVSSNDEDANASAGVVPGPGDRIQYRITYDNVSSAAPSGGQGNIVLNAQNLVITENGLGDDPNASTNNWAIDNDSNGVIDTSHVNGSAVVSQGTISYFNNDPATAGSEKSGSTAASDVTQYQNSVGNVPPGQTGRFSFQRLVN